MTRYLTALGVLAFMILAAATGLQHFSNEGAEMDAAYKTDIDALERLLKLDARPAATKWETREIGAGSDWVLFAEIEFSPEDFSMVASALTATPNPNGPIDIPSPPGWLDPDILTALGDGAADVSFAADNFASAPLLNGVTVINYASRTVFVYMWTN